MLATGIVIGPNDLARAIDAVRNGAVGGQGVVEGGVGVDWHLVVSVTEIDWKAEPFSNSLGLNCSPRACQRGASGGFPSCLKRAAALPKTAAVTCRHRRATYSSCRLHRRRQSPPSLARAERLSRPSRPWRRSAGRQR